MKLKTKIGGVPYKVEYVDGWHRVSHYDEQEPGLRGEVAYRKFSIRVDSELPPERQRRTLVHEMLHAVVEAYGIRELRDAENRHLEIPIDQLATGLCEALEGLGVELPSKRK